MLRGSNPRPPLYHFILPNRIMEDKYERELTDAILFQALRGSDFDYYYNYQAYPSKRNKYHGVIDYLIYNKSSKGHLPLIPVIKQPKRLNKDINIYEDVDNIYQVIGVAYW